MCFQLLHTSHIISVGILQSVQLAAGLNCAPKINETRCITEKENCKTSVAFVERAYPHDLINIPVQTCQVILSTRQRSQKKSKQNEY